MAKEDAMTSPVAALIHSHFHQRPEPEVSAPERSSIVRQAFTRRRWSSYLLTVGIVSTLLGLITAFSGFGLIFLALAPLWFVSAAILRPTRWRIALALFVLGCWAFGAYHVIT